MNNYCYNAGLIMHEYKKIFSYNNKEMLKLTIIYPQISLSNPQTEYKINAHINMVISDYKRYAKYLFKQAIRAYLDSQNNNHPFFGYEAYMKYNITYNENCFLSLYFDKYEFTGGAHGGTVRASDTWELCCGTHLKLSSFFRPGTDYRRLLTDEIIRQSEDIQGRQKIYFDDYKSLIIKNFNEDSFYLSPSGITIYYQQYDIAPYSTGIVEFTIPYSMIGWRPNC